MKIFKSLIYHFPSLILKVGLYKIFYCIAHVENNTCLAVLSKRTKQVARGLAPDSTWLTTQGWGRKEIDIYRCTWNLLQHTHWGATAPSLRVEGRATTHSGESSWISFLPKQMWHCSTVWYSWGIRMWAFCQCPDSSGTEHLPVKCKFGTGGNTPWNGSINHCFFLSIWYTM